MLSVAGLTYVAVNNTKLLALFFLIQATEPCQNVYQAGLHTRRSEAREFLPWYMKRVSVSPAVQMAPKSPTASRLS